MKVFGLQIHMVLIVGLVTLGLLLGGTHVYRKYEVDQSLADALESDPAVRAVSIKRLDGAIVLDLALERVDDLQEAYGRLNQAVEAVVDPAGVRLQVVDNRNERLVAAYRELHLYVAEAASTGRFSVLADRPQAVLSEYELAQASVTADENNIYVQLDDGEAYLYEVVPRRDIAGKGDAGTS